MWTLIIYLAAQFMCTLAMMKHPSLRSRGWFSLTWKCVSASTPAHAQGWDLSFSTQTHSSQNSKVMVQGNKDGGNSIWVMGNPRYIGGSSRNVQSPAPMVSVLWVGDSVYSNSSGDLTTQVLCHHLEHYSWLCIFVLQHSNISYEQFNIIWINSLSSQINKR